MLLSHIKLTYSMLCYIPWSANARCVYAHRVYAAHVVDACMMPWRMLVHSGGISLRVPRSVTQSRLRQARSAERRSRGSHTDSSPAHFAEDYGAVIRSPISRGMNTHLHALPHVLIVVHNIRLTHVLWLGIWLLHTLCVPFVCVDLYL